MQPPRRLTDLLLQPRLDVQVDVLELLAERELAALNLLADLLQAAQDRMSIVARDDPLFRQHPGMCNGRGDVVPVEAPVIGDRRAVLERPLVETARGRAFDTIFLFGHRAAIIPGSSLATEA